MEEQPVAATVINRFDLGFILKLPNGRTGQLRVPEMSPTTKEWDSSIDRDAGVGQLVGVYVVHEDDNGILFSEFSAEERIAREKERQKWLNAQQHAQVGLELKVRIDRKLGWGCICRQQSEPFLEGVLVTEETAEMEHLPIRCIVSKLNWERLAQGSLVSVVITHKKWEDWRYILYFSLTE